MVIGTWSLWHAEVSVISATASINESRFLKIANEVSEFAGHWSIRSVYERKHRALHALRPLVPIRCLLVSVTGAQHGCFIPPLANDLHPDRKPPAVKAARH
jgi:hypothetical protein